MKFEAEKPKRIKEAGYNEAGYPYVEYHPDHSFTIEDGRAVLEKISRRELLGGVAVTAGAVGTGALIGKFFQTDTPKVEDVDRGLERSRAFLAEVHGYREQVKLRFDEVLFTDASGKPVAIVRMQDFVVDRVNDEGETYQYLMTPGTTNAAGILQNSIAGEWLDHVRETMLSQNPEIEIDTERDKPRALTVYQQFLQALNDDDEPKLREKIMAGEITSYEEIIRYFSEQPSADDPALTRREYVQQNIEFKEWEPVLDEDGNKVLDESGNEVMKGVHPAAAEELRKLIPGLCAQESNFNNDLESDAGAIRIFQVLRSVLEKDYNFKEQDFHAFAYLSKQIEIAGTHISRGYARLRTKIDPLALKQMQLLHGDEDVFQREVMVPLTINGYNAGPDRVAAAVNEYFKKPENREKRLLGRDLFLDIIDEARSSDEGLLGKYGQHAREYTTRIYAKADIMNGER